MQVETGFQPNCSETVFRFSKKEIESLPKDIADKFWYAAANGITTEKVKEHPLSCLGLPNLEAHGGYSSLVREIEDHFTLCYYQTSNNMLLSFAIENLHSWLVEAPFTDDSEIPPAHNFSSLPRDDETLFPTKEFEEKSSPPKGFEAIIALQQVSNEPKDQASGSGDVPDFP